MNPAACHFCLLCLESRQFNWKILIGFSVTKPTNCTSPVLIFNPFCVVEHWKFRPDKARGLSERSEFRSARSKLKRTEQPKANTSGRLFFGSFLLSV
jgi:hypothetical protein